MAEKVPAGKSQTEAEKRINFSVLKKHDEKIDKIIDTASSVAHYKFNSLSAVWVSYYNLNLGTLSNKNQQTDRLFSQHFFLIFFSSCRLSAVYFKITLTPKVKYLT